MHRKEGGLSDFFESKNQVVGVTSRQRAYKIYEFVWNAKSSLREGVGSKLDFRR